MKYIVGQLLVIFTMAMSYLSENIENSLLTYCFSGGELLRPLILKVKISILGYKYLHNPQTSYKANTYFLARYMHIKGTFIHPYIYQVS